MSINGVSGVEGVMKRRHQAGRTRGVKDQEVSSPTVAPSGSATQSRTVTSGVIPVACTERQGRGRGAKRGRGAERGPGRRAKRGRVAERGRGIERGRGRGAERGRGIERGRGAERGRGRGAERGRGRGAGPDSETADDREDLAPQAKRTRKTLNKNERDSLLRYLNSTDDLTLVGAVDLRLKEAEFLSSKLQTFADVLCKSKLLQEIAAHHRQRFTELYMECKKNSDSFVQLQFCWHKYCSAFLLPRAYSINLNDATETSLVSLRNRWLDLCEANDVTVEGNPVMISASSAIYALLLERARKYQTSLIPEPESSNTFVEIEDDDDVYFRFGGATLCEMLQLHYKQIKDCNDTQRDRLSQEITILQAIKTNDKSEIPGYLKYRDQGYMYFPDASFIPLIRQIDHLVKEIVNKKKMGEDGGEIIKVCVQSRNHAHTHAHTTLIHHHAHVDILY